MGMRAQDAARRAQLVMIETGIVILLEPAFGADEFRRATRASELAASQIARRKQQLRQQAIALLDGVEAGKPSRDGRFGLHFEDVARVVHCRSLFRQGQQNAAEGVRSQCFVAERME